MLITPDRRIALGQFAQLPNLLLSPFMAAVAA
jgi:hypothetical protein